MNETEKAYIAGIIDARAEIETYIAPDKDYFRGFKIETRVSITGVKKALTDVLREYDINWGFYKQSTENLSYQIHFSKFEDIVFLFRQILPYLTAQKKIAELMIEYCESRLANRSDGGKWSHYTDAEIELAEKIQDLHNKTKR